MKFSFWGYAEVVSRPYRWADDGWKHAHNRNISEQCLYFEQACMADVLAGMGSGYMLFPHGMHCVPEVRLSVAALFVPGTLLYVVLQQVIGLCITALICPQTSIKGIHNT